jgi:valyl-tRNA synthetase
LLLEDRWVLSRLSTVTEQVTNALAGYKYADAARVLYDFAWDEFCSFFVEMTKNRLQNPASRVVTQRVLVHTLDVLLRLLHPFVPFVTEEVWQRLLPLAPQRGIDTVRPAAESIMIAPWPQADRSRQDPQIEAQFARFQQVLRAVRDIRSRQNVPPRQQIAFAVRCDAETAALLRPMASYFASMAGATATGWGPDIEAPELSANVTAPDVEVFVDLAELIDVDAEIARKQKELQKLEGLIAAKQKKLTNEKFVKRAPQAVVQQERDSLATLQEQCAATSQALHQFLALRSPTPSKTDHGE